MHFARRSFKQVRTDQSMRSKLRLAPLELPHRRSTFASNFSCRTRRTVALDRDRDARVEEKILIDDIVTVTKLATFPLRRHVPMRNHSHVPQDTSAHGLWNPIISER